MRNYESYYKRMDAGIVDKIDFIINYLPTDFDGTILDFGCANGKMIETLRDHFAEANFIGIDSRKEVIRLMKKENGYSNVRYYNSINDIPKKVFYNEHHPELNYEQPRFDVIIFSSVLHEVFSFINKPMKIIQAAKEAEYIFIRDMLYTETNQSYKIPHFNDGYGSDWLQYNKGLAKPEEIAEYLMKVRYEDNWHEELKESYFSVPYEEIDEYLLGSNFRKPYECNYMNEWLKGTIGSESGLDLSVFTETTHTKRIYKKRV